MTGFDLEEFPRTVEWIRQKAAKEGRLLYNPSDDDLRPIVEKEPGVKTTKYGNLVAVSEPMSRAAAFTQNSVDYPSVRQSTSCWPSAKARWPPRG